MNTLNELITSLKHNSSRDLAWAIFAPDLLTHRSICTLSPDLDQRRIDWLKDLDNSPEPLKNELYTGRSLGRYYESLWAFFFQHDKQYQAVSINLPVRDSSKTIGEFDFIIKDLKNNCFIHHEVAVKYYLFFQSHPSQLASNKNNWLGPNSQDTLHKKWRHITQHQSQLSKHASAKRELSKLGISNIKSTLAIKGYLFTPQNENDAPNDFNNNNALYHWYSIENFLSQDDSNKTLVFIPKRRWLNKQHEADSIELLDKQELLEKIINANTPLMAAYIQKSGNSVSEQQRFFVIPDTWPYCKL